MASLESWTYPSSTIISQRFPGQAWLFAWTWIMLNPFARSIHSAGTVAPSRLQGGDRMGISPSKFSLANMGIYRDIKRYSGDMGLIGTGGIPYIPNPALRLHHRSESGLTGTTNERRLRCNPPWTILLCLGPSSPFNWPCIRCRLEVHGTFKLEYHIIIWTLKSSPEFWRISYLWTWSVLVEVPWMELVWLSIGQTYLVTNILDAFCQSCGYGRNCLHLTVCSPPSLGGATWTKWTSLSLPEELLLQGPHHLVPRYRNLLGTYISFTSSVPIHLPHWVPAL